MHRHQRRRTRRVDRDRGPLEAEHIGHPARRHARGRRRARVSLHLRGVRAHPVALVGHPGEHADIGALQRHRVDARAFQGLPRRLQQQPLLRVHGKCLTRRNPEESGVEKPCALKETALAGVRRARAVRIRVEQVFQIPAPVFGEGRQPFAALADQTPQALGIRDAAGQPASHADDRDRLVGSRDNRGRRRSARDRVTQLVTQVTRECDRSRVVEDQRGGQLQTGRLAQAVAQFH